MKHILSIFLLTTFCAFGQIPTQWMPITGTNTYSVNYTTGGYTSLTNRIIFGKFANTNTGASTLALVYQGSVIGTAAIRIWDGNSWEALVGSEIDVNTVYKLSYNGTYWQMESFGGGGGGGGSGTVTSVAFATGTSGTDINVSGSPITSSGTITLNIPSASASARGLLTSSDWTTFNNKLNRDGSNANTDIDIGTNSLSARGLRITGTGGNGDLHLRWQSADATASGSSSALWADASGNLNIKIDGDFKSTFSTSGNTANRVYTFPDADVTLQSAITFGTDVQSALANNIGSAGAPVLFNGAGGTPSSLTLTNATGLPPTTGISGWPVNAAGVLQNNGSGTLSWASVGSTFTNGLTNTSGTVKLGGTLVENTNIDLNGNTLNISGSGLIELGSSVFGNGSFGLNGASASINLNSSETMLNLNLGYGELVFNYSPDAGGFKFDVPQSSFLYNVTGTDSAYVRLRGSLGGAGILIKDKTSTDSTSIELNGEIGKITSRASEFTVRSSTGTDNRFTVNNSGAIGVGSTASFGTSGQVLTSQGSGAAPTWTTVGGTGDVVGPASAVNNRVVFFDGTTGKLIKDSGLTLSGSNTGDQTSIVGITGTLAQFNTAVTDADLARTDAANTFTGIQSMTSPDITTSITTPSTTFSVANTTATTGNIFGAATTLNIGGTPTGAITHNYSTNATASGNTKTVNLGTGSAVGSTTNVNIGDDDGGTTTIASPTTSISGTLSVAGGTSSISSTNPLLVTVPNGSTTAFRLSDGTDFPFVLNTTDNRFETTYPLHNTTFTGTFNAADGSIASADLANSAVASLSGTNTGDQSLSHSSDATSHTATLSASGGSLKLIEGSNVTLTTSGNEVTISSTGGGGGGSTDLAFSGTSSPVTLTSSTGTDVTFTAGTNVTLSATGTDITINATGGGGVSDGDKGDITVSASGATWTVDDNAITPNKVYSSTISPAQLTADQDNWNPTGWDDATIIRVDGDASIRAITSFAAPTTSAKPQRKKIINIGSNTIYIPAEHPDGTAANRVMYYRDYMLFPKSTLILEYSTTDSRWIPESDYDRMKSGKQVHYYIPVSSGTAADHSEANWIVSGTGAANTSTAASTTLPAGFVASTGTTATAHVIVTVPETANQFGAFGNTHMYVETMFSVPTLSDGTDTYNINVGLFNAPTSTTLEPNNSVFIRYAHATNGGRFELVSKDNAGATSTADTGITVAINTNYKIRVEFDKGRTEARAYINDAFVGRVAANMPNALAAGTRLMIQKTVGVTARSMRYTYIATGGYF